MKHLERILVVAGMQPRVTAAMRRGIELARRAGAQLDVCLFAFDPLIDAATNLIHAEVQRLARTQYLHERSAWLRREAAALAQTGLRIDIDVVWAPALHEAVLVRALDTKPDLVIKDLAASRGERLFPTEDRKLARVCPAPLMLVRGDSPALPNGIAAAVYVGRGDEHPLNRRIVDIALRLGMYASAEVHVAHVFSHELAENPPYRRLEEVYSTLRREDEMRFREFCEAARVPADRRHMLEGEAATALADWSTGAGIGLMVCGSHYRSGAERFFLGSTAESLLDRAAHDLVLVRPDGFVDELARHHDLDAVRERHRSAQRQSAALAA